MIVTVRFGPGLAADSACAGLVNSVSGLPNLNALRMNKAGRNQALIVARILNYSEIVATLPAESERQLIEQIVGRLSVGSRDRTFYHGDGGIFAWFEEPRLPFGNHIDALYSLFRNPVRVGGLAIDLAISFGVEIGSGRSLGNRLGSALVAAEEAAHDGLKWKYPRPRQPAGRVVEAVDAQPARFGHRQGRGLGRLPAEARPRDAPDHRRRSAGPLDPPRKGPDRRDRIRRRGRAARPDRQADRLRARQSRRRRRARSTRRGRDFNIAVNLSARLLTDRNFTLRLSALLARHGLAARHLTLELTETAAMAGSGEAVEMLGRLRELGVNISIDDYGTGLSTLDYLKKIPAGEIKIDQSFVKAMCDNRSDRVMVQSTIALAHSLGRKVVAEGVEQREILEALIEMKCDVAQGFIIGRPMSLESLTKRLTTDRKRDVA